VSLQHAHSVVHRRAELDALKLRDLAVHDFEVVLHWHGSALAHLRLDCFCVDARDAEARQDVLHFHGDLVFSVLQVWRGVCARGRQVCLFFFLQSSLQ
jgi:hypothetical protein